MYIRMYVCITRSDDQKTDDDEIIEDEHTNVGR